MVDATIYTNGVDQTITNTNTSGLFSGYHPGLDTSTCITPIQFIGLERYITPGLEVVQSNKSAQMLIEYHHGIGKRCFFFANVKKGGQNGKLSTWAVYSEMKECYDQNILNGCERFQHYLDVYDMKYCMSYIVHSEVTKEYYMGIIIKPWLTIEEQGDFLLKNNRIDFNNK
jgi:hypothetical protein